MTPLDSWLGHWYAAAVLKTKHRDDVLKMFADMLDADQSMRTEAEKRLPQLRAVEKRCFVSKVQAQGLDAALKFVN